MELKMPFQVGVYPNGTVVIRYVSGHLELTRQEARTLRKDLMKALKTRLPGDSLKT